MKTLLILLLLCWFSSADGLKCYSCITTDNAACNRNTAPCEAPHDTCMSTVERTGSHKTILKKCTTSDFCSTAASANSMFQMVTSNELLKVTCCKTDLCNYSGATTASLHSLLLALPLCAISALCYVSA
ncbi:CD59A glycoprotein-like isoform X2 [Brienomyrus brachyistius]|uniref:CD59A glycoprotein-like isoform X2 n=1 Tax=Brienomyrus brachyistius TaxID=42636 RepID=UPI0020B3ED33|nr:CD59A glycoprotein-like isoform X2 [Brienomyrus brachyistius]